MFQRQDSADTDESFLLFEGVVAILGIVLVAISIGGVFNTVLLDARERIRETAILKAVGMEPRQIGLLVASSVVPLGLVAAVIGVPLGIGLERLVLGQMAEAADRTGLSPDILAIPRTRRPRRRLFGRRDRDAGGAAAGSTRGAVADRAGPAGGVTRGRDAAPVQPSSGSRSTSSSRL